ARPARTRVKRRASCHHRSRAPVAANVRRPKEHMRTALFLLAGFLLLAAFLVLARLFSSSYAAATGIATAAFVALWLILTGFNMWVGGASNFPAALRCSCRRCSGSKVEGHLKADHSLPLGGPRP